MPTDPNAKCNTMKKRGGNGLRRHQVVHVRPEDLTGHFDYLSVFLQFIHEHYCQNLMPAVDPDTPAAKALKHHIMELETRKLLLCSLKCRLQRWQNKKLILHWYDPLWNFVNDEEGNQELRLRCFRELGDLPDGTGLDGDNAKSVEWLRQQCRRMIVDFLLRYAQGTAGLFTSSPTKSAGSLCMYIKGHTSHDIHCMTCITRHTLHHIHCTTYIARHTHKYRGCDLEVSVNTSELRRSVHTCSQCIQPCDRTFIIRW